MPELRVKSRQGDVGFQEPSDGVTFWVEQSGYGRCLGCLLSIQSSQWGLESHTLTTSFTGSSGKN